MGPLCGEIMNRGSGRIEVICGPMFSGKTEELIRRLRRAEIARLSSLVFKPRIDVRYDAEDVVSHSRQRIKSVAVQDVEAIERFLSDTPPDSYQIVAVDEAQFFDETLPALVRKLADQRKKVVIAGLDQDYFGEPFSPIPELLALADCVTKQSAICMVCGEPATKTQRVSAEADAAGYDQPTEQVHVGATDAYEARCRAHFTPRVAIPWEKVVAVIGNAG